MLTSVNLAILFDLIGWLGNEQRRFLAVIIVAEDILNRA
jgi:hypothetical protein